MKNLPRNHHSFLDSDDAKQKLIDACFSMVLLITSEEHIEIFKIKPDEEKAKWVARQLEGIGFPTTAMGASWGVLDTRLKGC